MKNKFYKVEVGILVTGKDTKEKTKIMICLDELQVISVVLDRKGCVGRSDVIKLDHRSKHQFLTGQVLNGILRSEEFAHRYKGIEQSDLCYLCCQ